MLEIIQNKEFSRLPENMAEAAREAYEALLHTRDGQLCDVIIDRAALDAIYQAGLKAKDKIIKDYAESHCSCSRYPYRGPVSENRKDSRLYETGNGRM